MSLPERVDNSVVTQSNRGKCDHRRQANKFTQSTPRHCQLTRHLLYFNIRDIVSKSSVTNCLRVLYQPGQDMAMKPECDGVVVRGHTSRIGLQPAQREYKCWSIWTKEWHGIKIHPHLHSIPMRFIPIPTHFCNIYPHSRGNTATVSLIKMNATTQEARNRQMNRKITLSVCDITTASSY